MEIPSPLVTESRLSLKGRTVWEFLSDIVSARLTFETRERLSKILFSVYVIVRLGLSSPRLRNCDTIHLVPDTRGFGHLPLQIEIAQEQSVPAAFILVMKSKKIPVQAKKILGSKGMFLNCRPFFRHPGQTRFSDLEWVKEAIRRALPSSVREIRTLPIEHRENCRHNRALADRHWIGDFYDAFDPKTLPHWVSSLHVPRATLNALQNIRRRHPFLMGIYVRSKGTSDSRMHSRGRDFADLKLLGSFLQEFGPSWAGIIYGDVNPGMFSSQHLPENLYSAEYFGIRQSEVNLWIPFLVDRVVGPPGGGLTLAFVARKPICVVGAFGYHYGIPNALLDFRFPRSVGPSGATLFDTPWDIEELTLSELELYDEKRIRSLAREFKNWHPKEGTLEKDFPQVSRKCWWLYAPGCDLSSRTRKLLRP